MQESWLFFYEGMEALPLVPAATSQRKMSLALCFFSNDFYSQDTMNQKNQCISIYFEMTASGLTSDRLNATSLWFWQTILYPESWRLHKLRDNHFYIQSTSQNSWEFFLFYLKVFGTLNFTDIFTSASTLLRHLQVIQPLFSLIRFTK